MTPAALSATHKHVSDVLNLKIVRQSQTLNQLMIGLSNKLECACLLVLNVVLTTSVLPVLKAFSYMEPASLHLNKLLDWLDLLNSTYPHSCYNYKT